MRDELVRVFMEYRIVRILTGMVAAFASSIAAAFLSGFGFGFMISAQDSAQGSYDVDFAFFIAISTAWFSSIFFAPAILVLSAPLHLLAIRLRRVSGREYAFAGALVGMSVYLAVQLGARIKLLGLTFPGQMAIPALVIAPMLGATAALGFWAVIRPDKATSSHGQ
jgi:hypothetical protein